MQTLDIKIEKKSDDAYVIKLTGPMDSYTHENFDLSMEPILVSGTKMIILDMQGVEYISSMGIGSIFKIRNFTKNNEAEVMLVNVHPQVQKVMDAVQAMPQEAIFKSIEELDEYLDSL